MIVTTRVAENRTPIEIRSRTTSRIVRLGGRLAGALALSLTIGHGALAAAPDHRSNAPAIAGSADPAQIETALLRAPIGTRQCFTDAGWNACLSGIAPQLAAVESTRNSAAISDPVSRGAVIVVLFAALTGALGLVVFFWRHLAMSVVAEERRPARRRAGAGRRPLRF